VRGFKKAMKIKKVLELKGFEESLVGVGGAHTRYLMAMGVIVEIMIRKDVCRGSETNREKKNV